MPYKPKKAEKIPDKFYDKDDNVIPAGTARKLLRKGEKVFHKPRKKKP